MTGKRIGFLATASLAALVIAAPAAAQEAPAATPEAEEPAANEIVVTGYRAALGSAAAIKRNSDSIVDAIVSEDIGKLPDNNAAESIARVTGVTVLRYNDEAGDILVRGLPDVATTFNSREFFTADDRKLHLQDFPAGVAAGIEVYKSGTADLIEPGLAGLVNLRSRRPFEVRDTEIAGEIRASYNDQSQAFDPSGNLLLTKRWDTPIGEVGALINFSYVRTTYRNADRYADSAVISPQGFNTGDPGDDIPVTTPGVGNFRFPANAGNFYEKGIRHRPAINGTIQWRPTPDLELYAEGLWQAYRGDVMRDAFNVNFERRSASGVLPTISNVVLVPGEPLKAQSFTKTGGYVPEFFRSTQDDSTDTYQGAIGFKWKTGRATLSGDFAYTHSKYQAREDSVDAQLATAPTINVDWDVRGSAIFDLGGYDIANPANTLWRGYYQRDFITKGDGYQGRLDLDLETDIGWLPRIQFGLRATDRTSMAQNNNRYAYTAGLGLRLDSLPTGALEMITDGYRGDPQRFQNWLAAPRQSIRDNAEALRQLSYASLQQLVVLFPNDGGIREALGKFATEEIPFDPFNGFSAKESSYAAYLQGKYAFDLGGVQVDGTLGVRVVNTDGVYSGYSRVDGQPVKRDARQNYVDILPSFLSRFRFGSQWQMRLAFTETRTRPGFGQLNPSLNITRNNPGPDGSPPRYAAFGSGGNPDLQPLTSKNYDATLEYYFSKNGSASIAAFYRDLDGFISNYTRDVVDPVYGLIQINRPENAGKGRIKGVEASVQTFFDFLPGWLSGFGAQANVTYLDGTNALPVALGEGARQVKLTGLSTWAYNLTGFYEKNGISARLSYNRRSEFVTSYNRTANEVQYAGEITRPISRLDFSVSYDLTPGFTLVGNVSNILGEPFNNYRYYNETQYFPRDLRVEGRYFSLGLRFKM
ncbi:TonB-dependent receptor [Sphingomonas koreensis]|uniref:TonB-dependent receptor n=1 Tax=Sphingomonas koreensis TaxID=93064 RepID=UPI00082F7F86|nr:TonB-dependent receptor [Sphingomonas koreensis]PJI88500.1 TonB-dependent receptor [Sphingomonas koreensis]RSU55343.1 TonB-dependent receptor [Sphingomonas koreensis]RSU63970.1 TonB-dependent receptor [Sphingomonas koreensis]